MGMVDGPRDLLRRKADALAKLSAGNDVWVATTGGTGEPCLVPLSFAWTDGRIILVTSRRNRTSAQHRRHRYGSSRPRPDQRRRLARGRRRHLRPGRRSQRRTPIATARRRAGTRVPVESMVWIVFSPLRIRVWREVDELEERTVMEDGRWLV